MNFSIAESTCIFFILIARVLAVFFFFARARLFVHLPTACEKLSRKLGRGKRCRLPSGNLSRFLVMSGGDKSSRIQILIRFGESEKNSTNVESLCCANWEEEFLWRRRGGLSDSSHVAVFVVGSLL